MQTLFLHKYILFYFISTIIVFYKPKYIYCQNKPEHIEQIKNQLRGETENTLTVKLYNKLASYYASINLDSTKNYCDKAISLIENSSSKEHQIQISAQDMGDTYKNRAWYHYKKQDYLMALNDVEKAIVYYESENDRLSLGKVYTLLGNIYYRQHLYQIAEQHFTKSLQMLGIYRNDLGLASLYINYGGFLVNRKRYEEAWEFFNEALRIYEEIDYKGDWGLIYNNMGVCAGYLGDEQKKIEYYLKAAEQYENHNNKTNVVNLYHNLGIAYQKKQEYELSIQYLQKSVQSANETGILKFLPGTLENLSQSYFRLALLTQNSKEKDSLFTIALNSVIQAKSVADSLFKSNNASQINELLAKYETERKEKEIQKLNFQSELNELEFRRQEFELQSIILAANADREKTAMNQKLKEIAILKLEKENQFANLELKIRNAKLIEQEALSLKQKSEIELLQQTKKITELEQKRSKNLRTILWGSIIVLFIVLILILLLYLEKRKANISMMKHNLEIEQKQMEIQEQNVRLENINKFKDIFISNMSHEIRTPLNTIIGFSNILSKTKLSDEQKQQVESIEFASENLLALVNDILDFSKLKSDNIEFEYSDFDFAKNLEKLLSMFRYQADEKNLKLSLELVPQTPKYVCSDKYRLSQILINLIGNAVKFTDQGSISIKVEVLSVENDMYDLLFTVSDTGIGIERDHLERIFDAYTQLNNYNYMKHNGTGLGLAICKRLVELFGGDIRVSSKIGKGSSFSFNIPMKASKVSDIPLHQHEISSRIANKKILIVEDNTLNQTVIKTLLQSINATLSLSIAGNGQIALDLVKRENFDMIFMDMKMPIMDGLTATSIIRKDNTSIPIIALTANATNEEKIKCLQAGMNDFMVKPIDPSVLREKTEFWLSTAV